MVHGPADLALHIASYTIGDKPDGTEDATVLDLYDQRSYLENATSSYT